MVRITLPYLPYLPIALLAALICLPYRTGPRSDAADRERLQTIEQLLEQLGNDDFDKQEGEKRALSERADAEPALRIALKSPDLEIRKRAAEILPTLMRKRANR